MKSQRIRRSPAAAHQEIVEAAKAALGDMDFSALTVDRIMRRTGMTRSSFYHYFRGLDELAVALLAQFEEALRASVDPWLTGGADGDPVGATVDHLTAMFRVLEEHRTGVRAVAQAAGEYPAVYRQWQSRVVEYFIDRTADFIRRQVELGRSRARDPARLARSLILMNDAVANDQMLRNAPDDPEAVARVLADVWNAAIYGRTR